MDIESRSRSRSPSGRPDRSRDNKFGDIVPSEKLYVTFLPQDVILTLFRLKSTRSSNCLRKLAQSPASRSSRKMMGLLWHMFIWHHLKKLRKPCQNFSGIEWETSQWKFNSDATEDPTTAKTVKREFHSKGNSKTRPTNQTQEDVSREVTEVEAVVEAERKEEREIDLIWEIVDIVIETKENRWNVSNAKEKAIFQKIAQGNKNLILQWIQDSTTIGMIETTEMIEMTAMTVMKDQNLHRNHPNLSLMITETNYSPSYSYQSMKLSINQ